MKWFIIILGFVLNIYSEKDLYKIEKTFFLKNDFWHIAKVQPKPDKVHLYELVINFESKDGETIDFYYHPESFYLLKSTNVNYAVLENMIVERVNSIINSPKDEKLISKLIYKFGDDYKIYERRQHITYKLFENVPKYFNCINLKSDGESIRLQHITDMFKGFIQMKLLKFGEYVKNIKEKNLKERKSIRITDNADFKLYYFEKHSNCLDNLNGFIRDLNYFKLLDDTIDSYAVNQSTKDIIYYTFLHNGISYSISDMLNSKESVLKVSQFKSRLYKKFIENLKEMYVFEVDETWKELFDECFNYIKNEILNNNIFFPIEGNHNINYDINFYISQLSNLIFKSVKDEKREYTISKSKNSDVIFCIIACLLKNGLQNLQRNAIQELCKSNYLSKIIPVFLSQTETSDDYKTLDHYSNIERMFCDYYNMLAFIFNLNHKFDENSRDLFSFVSPIYIDNYTLGIVDGIRIEFDPSAKFKQLRGFNCNKDVIAMEIDSDYFIDKKILYCPSEVFNLKNIYDFEVQLVDDEKNRKKFRVSRCLCG